MKKSISHWSFPGGPEGTKDITEAMVEAKRKGFDAIELCFAPTGQLTPRTSQNRCDRILADAKDIGIEISSLCSGNYWDVSLTADSARERKRAYDFTVSYIRCARMLKLDAVLVVPGAVEVFFKSDFKRVQYDVVWKRSIQQLRKLARVAARHRVYLCIENVWNKFLLSPLEMKMFLKTVGSRWVGVYFDVGNVMLYGFPQQWIRILGRRIKRIHFKDFKTSVGTAQGFCDLLAGDVPWPEVMKALREVGYDGYCTAEMMPPDPTLLSRTSRAMDRIFAM